MDGRMTRASVTFEFKRKFWFWSIDVFNVTMA